MLVIGAGRFGKNLAVTLTKLGNEVLVVDMLLDLGLPDKDGLDLLRELRTFSSVPVLIVSARGQEKEKILALDLGANDYITKPFHMP